MSLVHDSQDPDQCSACTDPAGQPVGTCPGTSNPCTECRWQQRCQETGRAFQYSQSEWDAAHGIAGELDPSVTPVGAREFSLVLRGYQHGWEAGIAHVPAGLPAGVYVPDPRDTEDCRYGNWTPHPFTRDWSSDRVCATCDASPEADWHTLPDGDAREAKL